MKMLFSLVSLGIVVGIGIWWSLQSIPETELVVPEEDQTQGSPFVPINDATEAKMLIEGKAYTIE